MNFKKAFGIFVRGTKHLLGAGDTRNVERSAGSFSRGIYKNPAGTRDYKIYVPPHNDQPLPLVVMLHGCEQDADDFAVGTQMNVLAQRVGCLVVYPEQAETANAGKCWNWFVPDDQQRDWGEPSLIAGITREIMKKHKVDPARVFVAGLSAGGAMAAVMIRTYPDLYAAACVHSGIATGAAHDLPSALAAMRGGKLERVQEMQSPQRPIIVFHGDADTTVHPSNATEMMRPFGFQAPSTNRTDGTESRQHRCTVYRVRSAEGVDAELWLIHGGPHAWAGGNASGSFTDEIGPDASSVMLGFFLAHPNTNNGHSN